MRIRFIIPGRPRGWARATPLADGRMVTPEWMREHKKETIRLFRLACPNHKPWAGPVISRITAYYELPASASATLRQACLDGKIYYTGKSDYDNIAKLIGDELNAVAWIDDSQISGGCLKFYSDVARTVIELEFLKQEITTPAEHRRATKAAQDDLFGPPPKKRKKRSLNNWNPR